jgi:hypothetical protein
MIHAGSRLLCLCVAVMIFCSSPKAGVWGADPLLGVTADYATNPALLFVQQSSQTNEALLLDAPLSYNADDFKFFASPSFRVGDSKGYSSVTSDYEHLNLKGEFDTERDVLTAAAGLDRDSSLYQDYLTNGTAGVQRDSAIGDVNWDRFLTERVDFNTDLNWMQVRYGEAVGVQTLVSYKYTSITPTLSWNTSERNKITFIASVGRYDSLDGTTESRNGNLQVGFVRQLSEIYSLTAAAGYTRALNQLDTSEQFLVFTPNGPAIETVPIKEESSQNGTIYSINLARHGERLSFNAMASRQLVPSGFAYLSRQEAFELQGTYSYSDRWSFSGDARYLKAQDAELEGQVVDRTLNYFTLSASWLWTEHWTVKLSASRVTERFQSPDVRLVSNEVALTLSRQFNHVKFQ